MGEFIWMHFGQAGIQIGVQFWNRMMKEHAIGTDGKPTEFGPRGNVNSLFYESENGKFIPRALFIDTDSMAIEETMKTNIGQLLDVEQFINGKEAAVNYARAHYMHGPILEETIIRAFLNQVSKCENIEALLIFNSLSGGTGSGLFARFIDRIWPNYYKLSKICFSIIPSEDFSSNPIEPI